MTHTPQHATAHTQTRANASPEPADTSQTHQCAPARARAARTYFGAHPVQRAARADTAPATGADAVHQAAREGISGAGSALPHLDAIQMAFGRHDVSGVRAHTGEKARQASDAIGAHAYASGNDIAFGASPSLHTAAHEAAHIIQQRVGVSLSDGIGAAGDAYERHADAVADRVVRGESAEDLLDRFTGT